MRGPKVIFRDEKGRFLPYADRYKPSVKMIQAIRGGRYVDLAERSLPPVDLANVLSRREFEALPEALRHVKDYQSKKKYTAWDVAEQIDKTKGIRRKQLKVTMEIADGKRKKTIVFYHQIKRNTSSSYNIFRRINEEVGLAGGFLYDRLANGKHLADRKGKKVHLVNVHVEAIV